MGAIAPNAPELLLHSPGILVPIPEQLAVRLTMNLIATTLPFLIQQLT
jgi:hypothetical protein